MYDNDFVQDGYLDNLREKSRRRNLRLPPITYWQVATKFVDSTKTFKKKKLAAAYGKELERQGEEYQIHELR